MSRHDQETTMGGTRGTFLTTRWSQIQKAKTHDEERRKASVNNLLDRYWKPVYCHLRSKGYANEDAKDLTQGFFLEIVLNRELIQQADQTKGRFRSFLLTALDCYMTSADRKRTAKKRLPEGGLRQLEASAFDLPIPPSKTRPEQIFHYAWATDLLDEVLTQVKDEYCSTERASHWHVFHARILSPTLDNSEATSLPELCERYGIRSEKRASNMIITVKRRFAAALRHQLRQYAQSDSEVEDEFHELVEILSEGSGA